MIVCFRLFAFVHVVRRFQLHFCVPCYCRCCVLAVVDFVVAFSVFVVFAVSVEVVVFDGDSF